MSAWWILPSLTLVAGAFAVWWAARRLGVEMASLQEELNGWADARRELVGLQADGRDVGARYRSLRRR